MTSDHSPRIALIHALEESLLPARAAFAADWPQAACFDLLDTSLAIDLAEAGRLDDSIMKRFQVLADYAAGTAGRAGQTLAILFTCSAFGPAINAVKTRLTIPVLRPNESAFEEALDLGDSIGLLVTFGPSLPALEAELQAMAAARGRSITVKPILVDAALAALKQGDGDAHDRLAAEACRDLGPLDALVLGQFSLARAAPLVRQVTSAPVLTTPGCAVRALRKRLVK
jgi:Asp/Glu/hydantoin racemase